MKKKILSLLIVLVLSLGLNVIGFATEQSAMLVDDADLLTELEAERLSERLDAINQKYDVDIYIVTADTIGTQSTRRYAEQFGDNAVVLLVVMDQRDYSITSTGKARDAFTNAAIEDVLDVITDDMSQKDFAGAFEGFIKECDTLLGASEESFASKLAKNIGVSLVIGLVVALIVTGIMASKLKSVRSKAGASDYVKAGSLNVTVSRDMFLYRKVDRRAKPKSSGGSSSGSSGSNHGSRKF